MQHVHEKMRAETRIVTEHAKRMAQNQSTVRTDDAIPAWKTLAVLSLGVLTALLCLATSPPTTTTEPGVRMVLPAAIRGWTGRDEPISKVELFTLPKDTQFARKAFTSPEGDTIICSIILSGTEKRSIHRPEVCLPGQGWTIKSSRVQSVNIKVGGNLDVTVLDLSRIQESGVRGAAPRLLEAYYVYWFVGDGVTTPHHWERIFLTSLERVLHRRHQRWAYVTVLAPVSVGWQPAGKNATQTLDMLDQFIGEIAPSFQKSFRNK